jgi:hypothetical protein
MRGSYRSPSSRHFVAPALACVTLSSGLTAQQPRNRLPPAPAVQCYAISPDTGSRPWFLPEHLVLGANPSGGIGLRVAAVLPDRVRSGSRQDTLVAQWRSYGPLYVDDSIYVEFWIHGSTYGPIGVLYGHVRGDSLSGRATERSDAVSAVVRWLPIHGRSEVCPSRH